MKNNQTVMQSVRLLASCCAALLLLASCGGGGGGGGDSTSGGGSSGPSNVSAATVTQVLEVPSDLTSPPFDTPKTVRVPPGFKLKLWARVDNARFMALAPNGDVLVTNPGAGTITLLRETSSGSTEQFQFAAGMTFPHDMVFHQIGEVTYLYIAESNQVSRTIYQSGDTSLRDREVIVANLPDESTTELQGAYAHRLKNIALSSDNQLFVSIASSCNACAEDSVSDPVRGAIYQYNADGSNPRLYARGLRNAEGLDFIPGTQDLWITVANRDEMLYPFNNDFDGDGSDDYGKLIQSFVDFNPPELFTRVRPGANYGWPYCNALPNDSMSNLELVADVEFNPNGSVLDCSAVERPTKGMRAHSTALGLSFLHDTAVPAAYRRGAVTALHGCWNCSRFDAGYKVSYFPFDDAGNSGSEVELVTGFVANPDDKSTIWGRPVDVIADAKGRLLISDDLADAIYVLEPSS
jgi:glucose/arabinose dehydrogenase